MKKHILIVTLAYCLLPLYSASAQYSVPNAMLNLNGASYLSVANSMDFNRDLSSAGYISIDAWVRPTTTGSEMAIVGNDRTVSYWFGMSAGQKLMFYPNPTQSFESNSTLTPNTWTHVAVSFYAYKNSLRFYINGVLDRQITTPQTYIGVTTSDLRIGADRTQSGPANYWTGNIDEVRIWDNEMDFTSALGLLYRVPLAMLGGLHGRHMKGGWRLNGNGNSVGGLHNASAVGSVGYSAAPDPPLYDRICAVFSNGPDYHDRIVIPHSSPLTLLQNYTLECWVKPTTGGSTSFQSFISKGDAGKNVWNYWLGLNKSNGKVRFIPTGNWSAVLESTNAIPLNTWTHVAARFQQIGNSHQATIFINGAAAGSTSYSTTGSGNSYDLLFGSSDRGATGGVANGYSGRLDEVRLWNVARSNDEISDHHRMELSGPINGLVADYHFDGDDEDASGNSHDGTGDFTTSSSAYFEDASSLPSQPTLTLISPLGGERWEVGEQRPIRWSSDGLANVMLELSTDGGQTFPTTIAPSLPAAGGVYSWLVPGPPTFYAVVRVRPVSTELLARSSGLFEIQDPQPVLDIQPSELIFTTVENGPLPDPQFLHLNNIGGALMTWTVQRGSKLWYDVNPTSGSGNSDSVEIAINTSNLPIGVYSDQVKVGGNAINAGQLIKITLRIVPEVSRTISGHIVTIIGAPIEGVRVVAVGPVERDGHSDASGQYQVTGLLDGTYGVAPVSPYFTFNPTNRTIAGLTADTSGINFIASPKAGNMVIRYAKGWNLISIPMPLADMSVKGVFPNALGKAYRYMPDMGYVEVDEFEYGRGYWVNFSKRDSVIVNGTLASTLEYSAENQFGGWNLMGMPSGPVAAGLIQQQPTGALVGIYAYDPDTGYLPPPGGLLEPGRGYFVKVNVEALLRLVSLSFTGGGSGIGSFTGFPNASIVPADLPPPPPNMPD